MMDSVGYRDETDYLADWVIKQSYGLVKYYNRLYDNYIELGKAIRKGIGKYVPYRIKLSIRLTILEKMGQPAYYYELTPIRFFAQD